MQFPDENPQLCANCKQRPATARYTRANLDEMLCALCLDRWEVQDALDERYIHHINDLEIREQYDEVLTCLDEFLKANRHRDHDKWLARSVARERAIILFDAGRYAEAEKECAAWVALGIDDAGDRWMYGATLAKTLDAQGRTREGVAVLEDALGHRDPKDTPGAWMYLWRLAELSAKIGQPVDPRFRSLAQETAARHGLELPTHESLGDVILNLAETIGGKEELDDDADDEPTEE